MTSLDQEPTPSPDGEYSDNAVSHYDMPKLCFERIADDDEIPIDSETTLHRWWEREPEVNNDDELYESESSDDDEDSLEEEEHSTPSLRWSRSD